MKLLLDHNLSPRLVDHLQDIFPGISHVALLGLDRATDVELWEFAKKEDFIIVTKDADFNDFVTIFGSPPKVVRIRLGNCTTSQVEKLLRKNHQAVEEFSQDGNIGFLSVV